MEKAHKALQDAIQAYRDSYSKDPRFRRVIAALDGITYETKRLSPQEGTSPGNRAAVEAALNRPRGADEQVRQSAPEAPTGSPPSDYSSARQMAAARFSEARGA